MKTTVGLQHKRMRRRICEHEVINLEKWLINQLKRALKTIKKIVTVSVVSIVNLCSECVKIVTNKRSGWRCTWRQDHSYCVRDSGRSAAPWEWGPVETLAKYNLAEEMTATFFASYNSVPLTHLPRSAVFSSKPGCFPNTQNIHPIHLDTKTTSQSSTYVCIYEWLYGLISGSNTVFATVRA